MRLLRNDARYAKRCRTMLSVRRSWRTGVLTEHRMDQTNRFYALEVMCRERARAAQSEANYWLAEAEEWARFRQARDQGQSDRTGANELNSDVVKARSV